MRTGAKLALWGGKRTPTAKDYPCMPDVFYYDALENAGYGQYNPSLTVWKDLVGSADISLFNAVIGADYVYFLKGSSSVPHGYGTANFVYPFGAIEMVLSKSVINNTFDSCIISIGSNSVYQGWGLCAPYGQVTDTYDADSAPYVQIQSNELFSVVINKDGPATVSIAKNGIVGASGTMTTGSRYSNGTQCINGGANSTARASELYVRAIRGHSSPMTAQEIAANYAVDVARYKLPQGGAS